jgi:hypothetical protein
MHRGRRTQGGGGDWDRRLSLLEGVAPKLNPPAAGAAADDPPKEKAMVMRGACREGMVVEAKGKKMRARGRGGSG